jgi:hypothetical protein
MSVHAQCIARMSSHVARRLDPAFRVTPQWLADTAEHITRLSLAGIRASAAAV